VILDSDLARLYGVTTSQFNQAVKRNFDRFPADFMFQVSEDEHTCLRSQNVISNPTRGGRRFSPYVFTKHDTVMAASILNNPKAIEVSVYVVRAFIQQRAMLAANAELALKLERLEKKLLAGLTLTEDRLDDHENQLQQIIEAIRDMRTPPAAPRRPIGFRAGEDEEEE
jgi:hypothetical protein